MPVKNVFKKSLLNCQPILTSSSKVVSTGFDKTDGFAGVATGFSTLIERQNGLNPRTEDSISLSGVSDFEGSEKFSVDPQRPEIIAISKLFEGDPKIYENLLKLRDFESSIDEADIKTIYDNIFSNEKLKNEVDKRIEIDFKNREIADQILSSLSQIALSIDNFRDSIDFLGANKKIHTAASINRSKIADRFSEDPAGSLMSFSRTFLGLTDSNSFSNTSLIQALFVSLLLPGSIKFSNRQINNVQGSKFLLPAIQHDSVSDFLQFLGTKDITESESFFDVETRLPSDPYAKLSLLSDSLSYELITTVGLKKLGRNNIFEILEENVNPTLDVIREEPTPGTVTSNLRLEQFLPFEIRKNTVDGVSYGGALEAFIDPVISEGNLNFENLISFSKNISSNFGGYINSIDQLRGINKYQGLRGTSIIANACDYILRGSKSILTNSRNSVSPLQLSFLVEISKNNTSNGTRSRYDIFKEIYEDTQEEGEEDLNLGTNRPRPGTGTNRPRPGTGTNRPRPGTSTSSSKVNSFINSTPFKNLISGKNSSSSKARAVSSRVDNKKKAPSVITNILNIAKDVANKNTKKQLIAATNISVKSVKNKTIKSFKRSSEDSQIKKDEIKNETSPEKKFQRETIKSILGELALNVQSGVYSLGGNTSIVDLDENDSDVFDIKEGKIEIIGTTYATLEKFELNLNDVYNKRTTLNKQISFNPISDISNISSVSVVTTDTKKSLRRNNKFDKINLLTLGALPFKRNLTRVKTNVKIQSNAKISNMQTTGVTGVRATQLKTPVVTKKERNFVEKPSFSSKINKVSSTLLAKSKARQLNRKLLNTSAILGTSLFEDGIKEHFKLASTSFRKTAITAPGKKIEQLDPRTLEKIDALEELSNMFTSVGLLRQTKENKSTISKNKKANIRKINLDFLSAKKRTNSISERFNNTRSIDSKYLTFFNTLLDGTNDNVSSTIYNSNIDSILKQIKSKNTIIEQVDEFYNFISSDIDSITGINNTLNSYTSNYRLDKTKIKFIIFQIFMSILSVIRSTRMVKIQDGAANNQGGFKVQARIERGALEVELNSISSLANSTGSGSDIISSGRISSNFSEIIKAMCYCSISNDLVCERFSVAKTYLDIYTTSVTSIVSIASSPNTLDALKKLQSLGNLEILKNLSQEYISSKQFLYTRVFGEPLSIKPTTRLVRIALNVLTSVLSSKNDDTDVIITGLPIKSIETLRRINPSTSPGLNVSDKEYIELEFTKRNVQFSDLIQKSSKVRFSQRLEVIPQFTDATNLTGQAEDFLYLCYEDGNWAPKSFSEAAIFINSITGLSYVDSTVIVMNHIIDAMCKLLFGSLVGFSIEEFMSSDNIIELSQEGLNLLNSMLNDINISKVIPCGQLQQSEYVEKLNGNLYKLKNFAELDKDSINKTDQSTHRLFSLFLSDPIFSTEFFLSKLIETGPFERVYCSLLNQEDYIFDNVSSYSTRSGRANLDGLIRLKILEQKDNESKFIDNNFVNRLDADEISVRINLVSN
jgi:hypothetical protein